MENKKIYPSQQLVCALDALSLKVFMWLCGWQSQGDIKLFVGQMSKFLHIDEEEVELSIQTLLNAKLITIKKDDKTFIANLNGEQVQKYFSTPIAKIAESGGVPRATEVTWNKTSEVKKESSNNLDDMSEQELKMLLLRIEASLNEKQQIKKAVVSPNNKDVDDLPW